MASVSRFLTKKLLLKVNEAKSAVARPEEREFLGFTISNDGSERRIAPKALDKFKTLIRGMTRRTRGISLPQLIKELKPYLIGWRGYFGFCQTPRMLTNMEAWIRRRLRLYLWRQWANGHNRFNELRRRGVPKFSAAAAAGSPTGFWRMSGDPAVQQALRNHCFESLGLPRLYVSAQAFEPPWYVTRMPGGVGGAASRGVPLSRSAAHSRRSTRGAGVISGAWRTFRTSRTVYPLLSLLRRCLFSKGQTPTLNRRTAVSVRDGAHTKSAHVEAFQRTHQHSISTVLTKATWV